MSSQIKITEDTLKSNLTIELTSKGTARNNFAEILEDGPLKNQIANQTLTNCLKNLKKQFELVHIGKEYFFQALDFICWTEPYIDTKLSEENQRFAVLLCGLLLMRKANSLGSSCLPWKILKIQINEILLNSGFYSKELKQEKWKEWLLKSFGSQVDSSFPSNNSIFKENNSLFYYQKLWQEESNFLLLLEERIKIEPKIPDDSIVEKILQTVLFNEPVRIHGKNINLDEEQKKAILFALSSPILIITGGPGTGKTSFAVTLLRVLKRLGLAKSPAIAAPTGRAAKRISESIVNSLNSIENLKNMPLEKKLLTEALNYKTIHRLLAYQPATYSFKHHEYAPLEHDLLIVDEGSMIDQEIMTSILRATNSKLPHIPPVPRIILMGDSHQLPSIGIGAVLWELAKNESSNKKITKFGKLNIVKFRKSFRQQIEDDAGRNILGIADKIKEMESIQMPEVLFDTELPNHETIQILKNLEEFDYEKVMLMNQENSPHQLDFFARWWVENYLSNKKFVLETQYNFPQEETVNCINKINYIFDFIKNFQILTATQFLPTGAKTINKKVSEYWQILKGVDTTFSGHYPGEPVMVTENNYKLKLFNGDQGVFLKFFNPNKREFELKVVFLVEGVFKTFYQHELHHLQTAYAITVHKSQGSEYNHIALILPNLKINKTENTIQLTGNRNIMSREMLYTALTRARKSVLIIGDKNVLEESTLNKVIRYSGIGDALLIQ